LRAVAAIVALVERRRGDAYDGLDADARHRLPRAAALAATAASVSGAGWSRCPILNGRAWALGLDVTAALILPPARDPATPVASLLLTPIDPSFPTRVAPGDILVGGGDFASGTTDDQGVRAMLALGVAAVVAFSLDPSFARFAFARGLPAVEVNEALGIHTGETLRVDLEGSRVVNMSSGDRYPIRNVDDALLARFRPTDA
jgi:3-isopropylmalate/(R)-2-methylmalate dehydratase small subunit